MKRPRFRRHVVLGKYTMTWMISIIALIILTCVVLMVALGTTKCGGIGWETLGGQMSVVFFSPTNDDMSILT